MARNNRIRDSNDNERGRYSQNSRDRRDRRNTKLRKETIDSFESGLHTDFSPNRQPDGTYRFALNTISETTEGDLGFRSNELSNESVAALPEGFQVLGHTYISGEKDVIFAVNSLTNISLIGTLDKNYNFETLIESDCLDFNICNEIEATYRVKNGCDTIIYFVDHLNPDRSVNLNYLEQYIKSDYQEGTDNPLSKWNCEEFQIEKIDDNLSVSFLKYLETGNLPIGTIQLVVRHLDSNKNGAGYTIATETIPVIDDRYSETYLNIDGNIAMNSNKSIEFEINGINLNYEFLEVTAIVTTASVTSSYVVAELPITESLIRYTVTSIDDSVPTDVRSISSVKEIYSSKSITQLENRLIRSNIKCNSKNYSGLQQYANDIKSHYEVYEQDSTDVNDIAVKTGDYYWYGKSYMRDEIYAFGIVYKYNNNTFSPVMHIPGRAKDSFTGSTQGAHRPDSITGWDSTSYDLVSSSWDNVSSIPDTEAEHLSLIAGDTVERWKVYNTAYKDSSLNSNVHSAGQMAYHESNANYPNTKDCNDNFIFGDLVGTPIRHHKFPDSSLEPHSSNNNIHPIGIKFKNIILPPDTKSYRIVRCDRDENKTVLDKGISFYGRISEVGDSPIHFQPFLGNLSKLELAIGPTTGLRVIPDGLESGALIGAGDTVPIQNTISDRICFHSPLTKFVKPFIKASYLKTENVLNAAAETPYLQSNRRTSIGLSFNTDDVEINVNPSLNTSINSVINKQAYIGKNSILPAGILTEKFINNYSDDTFAIETNSNVRAYDGNTEVFTHANDTITEGSNGSGGTLRSGSQAIYQSLKVVKDVYNNLNRLIYYTVSKDWTEANETLVLGGDTFITRFNFINSGRMIAESEEWVNEDNKIADRKHNYSSLIGFFTESTINSELRHELPGELYYPKTLNAGLFLNCITDDGSGYTPNYYNYNSDFHKPNNINAFISLPNSYRYCSDCECLFPNRVLYSERSFQEELADNYLNSKTNNYRDILANKGDITKIFNYQNKLFIDTEESRFYLPSTNQAIQSNESQVFIGTGEFFSASVQELVDSDVGYMGNQSQRAFNITEHGVFSLDARDGKVFLFNGKTNVISNKGKRNFFENNLELNLETEYEDVTGLEFPCPDNPTNNVGFVAGYDTRYDRWLLTKHDFKLTDKSKRMLTEVQIFNPNIPSTGSLKFENGNWYIVTPDSFSTEITKLIYPKNEPTLFENCSWTISYSVKDQSWTSFHSYIPNYYIDSKTKLYSTINNDNNIWKHHKRFEYQTFYGVQYPHIIEVVANKNPIESSIHNAVRFHTQAQQWDPINKYFIDKRLITFDKANLYNSYQSSGDIDLLTKRVQNHLGRDQESWHQQALLDINEKEYSFNEFRDLVENRDIPLFTKNWEEPSFQDKYYIDKVINPTSINLNKNWWEQEVFRDKYLLIRLFFTTFVNTKLITNFNITDKNYTER